MGMVRKGLSVFTLGGVDWKSDKERTATSARKTKVAAKQGNKIAKKQVAQTAQQNVLLQAQLDAMLGPGYHKMPDGTVRYVPGK